jgi:endoglucanase
MISGVSVVPAADSDIRLSSLGYLPGFSKKATIVVECSNFVVRKAGDDSEVYTGAAAGPVRQDDVDQNVWIADFSGFNTPGEYYLEVKGVGRTFDFDITGNAYDFAYFTSMRAFYLWRCGTALSGEHSGDRFAQAACHLDDGYDDYIGNSGHQRDGTGGWHDAGDYGKYVVNAAITAGCLFLAWDHFQEKLQNKALDLPETGRGMPDFLAELKWEVDWMLKMPYPDKSGRVSHKLTRLNFSGFVMPDTDKEKRYFTVWSSAATADFVATMAMAARYFEPYDAAYAQTCREAATRSYEFLKNNPDDERFRQGDFRTGAYGTRDPDDRLWAAAEMWETTGKAEYLKDFEARAGALENMIDENWDWQNVQNLGMFTYILSKREGRSSQLVERIRKDVLVVADTLVNKGNQDVYGRPLAGRYYWGCNGTVARQTINLHVANMISPNSDYLNMAVDAISHLFGRNFYGRSYVTGLGHNPPLYPHDRRSGADEIAAPWPGYVVGGGHSATDWHDEQEDYRTNEIAINWQGALVYALAAFVSSN